METKWKAAGYPIDEMPPDIFPFDLSQPHVERAKRAITLLRAGVVGEPVANPDSSPETQALLFDVIARSANTDAVNGQPVTIQWRFSDAAPWYIRIDNGATEAVQGEAPEPEPDPGDLVARLPRGLDLRRRPAAGDAAPQAAAPRLDEAALEDAANLPAGARR